MSARRIYPVSRAPKHVSERVLAIAHVTAALQDDVLSEPDKAELRRIVGKLGALANGETPVMWIEVPNDN